MSDLPKFDKNVPIPPRKSRRGRPGVKRSPMWFLEVGESYFAPFSEKKPANVAAYARVVKRRSAFEGKPRTFEVHETTENGVEGVRVWRKS